MRIINNDLHTKTEVYKKEMDIRDMLLIAGLDDFPSDFRECMPMLIKHLVDDIQMSIERYEELQSEVISMLMSSKVDMHVQTLKQTPWVIKFEENLEKGAKEAGYDRNADPNVRKSS